ncbi:hypothetical protein D6D04_02709 [Aureobasidium pullulans]|nr:hypothetical protein D6D04_02709 [Aureobasidium pullulans]
MPDLNTKSDAESHNNDQAQTRLPTQTELEKVAEVDILDKNGDKKKFSSLWSSHSDKPRRRTIVIFIRHFNCESCADYVRALTAKLSPEDLASRSIPTELFIVGCGSHTFIQTYIQRTGCKFEIYTDPSRVTLMGTLIGTGNTLMTLLTDSGKKSQNGGELIWVDGEIKWARRMQNTRDHVEVEELERVLDKQE